MGRASKGTIVAHVEVPFQRSLEGLGKTMKITVRKPGFLAEIRSQWSRVLLRN
jgi:hypothetical protein